MAITTYSVMIDKNHRELIEHGTVAFPIAVYHDDLAATPVPWHWHDEMELFVITQGTADVTIGNERYVLTEGNGCFINSGILHSMKDRDNSGCRFHSMVFSPSLVAGSGESVFSLMYVNPLVKNTAYPFEIFSKVAPWHRDAVNIIEKVWQTCRNQPAGYHITVRNLLSELVSMLCRNMPQSAVAADTKNIRDGERIKTMLAYIYDNFRSDVTIQAVADAASISKSECLRCFRNMVGTTPIQYLKQYRIQRACQMLENTSAKITDIAARCGFAETSYFIKLFREEKGITPNEYRRALKENL